MITQNFFYGLLAYIIFNFAFAIVWNLVIFKKAYEVMAGKVSRTNPIIPLGFLAIIVQGFSLTILFSSFYRGINPIGEGLFLGLLVGSFSVVYGAFVVPAKFTINPIWKYAALELAYGVIHYAIAGIILAYIFLM